MAEQATTFGALKKGEAFKIPGSESVFIKTACGKCQFSGLPVYPGNPLTYHVPGYKPVTKVVL